MSDDSNVRPAQRRRQSDRPKVGAEMTSRDQGLTTSDNASKPPKPTNSHDAGSSNDRDVHSIFSPSEISAGSSNGQIDATSAPLSGPSPNPDQDGIADHASNGAPILSPVIASGTPFIRTRSSSQSIASMAAGGQTPTPQWDSMPDSTFRREPVPTWSSDRAHPLPESVAAQAPPSDREARRTGRSSSGNGLARLRSLSFTRVWSDESRNRPVDPDKRLDDLLSKLHFKFTREEVQVLQRAYCCGVCRDADATCHQIRAVYDAFNLAWSEEKGSSGLLRPTDLDAFVSKCELGEEFLIRLKQALQERVGLGPEELITARQFLLGFAHVLLSLGPGEARFQYNRVFWRMFGMEMTKQVRQPEMRPWSHGSYYDLSSFHASLYERAGKGWRLLTPCLRAALSGRNSGGTSSWWPWWRSTSRCDAPTCGEIASVRVIAVSLLLPRWSNRHTHVATLPLVAHAHLLSCGG